MYSTRERTTRSKSKGGMKGQVGWWRATVDLQLPGGRRPWMGSSSSMGNGEAGDVGNGKNAGWWQLQSSVST